MLLFKALAILVFTNVALNTDELQMTCSCVIELVDIVIMIFLFSPLNLNIAVTGQSHAHFNPVHDKKNNNLYSK